MINIEETKKIIDDIDLQLAMCQSMTEVSTECINRLAVARNMMEDLTIKIETDERKIRKYDEENQMPVGTLSMLFSPVGIDLRKKFQENKVYEIINTKNGKKKGYVVFSFGKKLIIK